MVLATFKKKTGFISNKPIVRVPKISAAQKRKNELIDSISISISNDKNGKIKLKVVK